MKKAKLIVQDFNELEQFDTLDLDEDDYDEEKGCMIFILKDGRRTIEADGVDWKESTKPMMRRMTKKLKEGQELVSLFDGSDTLWVGIVEKKVV